MALPSIFSGYTRSLPDSIKSPGGTTATFTLDNFPQITNRSQKMFLTLSDARLEFSILPRGIQNPLNVNNDSEDVCVRLRVLSSIHLSDRLHVKYKVAVKDAASQEKDVYTQEYLWTFEHSNKEHYSKFISRSMLISPYSDMIDDHDSVTFEISIGVFDKQTFHPQPHFSPEELSGDLKRLYQSEKFADFTLVAHDGQRFKAHKAILASRSPMFAAMLEHDTKEKAHGEMQLHNFAPEICKVMIEFLYTGKVESMSQHAEQLVEVADMYQLESLKRLCEQYLENNATVETACKYLLISDLYNFKGLKCKSIELISSNMDRAKKSHEWAVVEKRPDLLVNLCEYLSCFHPK